MLMNVFIFLSVLLTAFYITRLVWMVFMNEVRSEVIWRQKVDAWRLIPLAILGVFSIWILQGFNPLGSTGYALIFSQLGMVEFHENTVLILSIMLSIFGVIYSAYLFRNKSTFLANYLTRNRPHSMLGQLSFSGVYLDDFYARVCFPIYLSGCHCVAYVERKLVDGFVDGFGIFIVLFSKVLGIFDRWVIDGLVKLVSGGIIVLGNWVRPIQSRIAQRQILWLIIGLILILCYILI